MNLKFVPDLFLEVAELNRFKKSLDESGFRKNIIENSENFGLIQNKKNDPSFENGKVARDFDNSLGGKTIKIQPTYAIDSLGRFIYQEQKNLITIPSDDQWWWVSVKHTYTSAEVGTFSISADGELLGSVDTKLLEVLRGLPNFPSRVRFKNAVHNTLEYDILEVIDNRNAILQHPAVFYSGTPSFEPEQNLILEVVGTFTPGIAVPSNDKCPYQYDSSILVIAAEGATNVRPEYNEGLEFFLARVKVVGDDLIVQDKRTEYWETKGSQKALDIDRSPNPLIGVEAVKWNSVLTPSDTNIVEIAWGMRSQNWTVNSSINLLTLQGSALGGRYKTVNDFEDGDLNGWRVYTDNGKYSRILNSVKQGAAINLVLDVLDVDNYSTDGGISFTGTDWVLVVPDAEEIVIKCTPNALDFQEFLSKEISFPINTLVAKIPLVVFKDPNCLYNIKYRYSVNKEFTKYLPIPDDTNVGYYTEISFDSTGNIKSLDERVVYPYTSSVSSGFIKLVMSANSYSKTISFVNKGDLIGVNTVTELTESLYDIYVGISKNYQHIIGNYSLENDIRFDLSKLNTLSGNEFRFHFECTSLELNGKNIYFTQLGDGTETIKTITENDVTEMYNQEKGIVLDFVYDGERWIMYQNYSTEPAGLIKTIDGVISDMFDSDGKGKIRGFYNHYLCDGRNGMPNLVDKFILGAGTDDSTTINVGDSQGNNSATLVEQNIPKHRFGYQIFEREQDVGSAGSGSAGVQDSLTQKYTEYYGGEEDGSTRPINIKNPYYALIFYKKKY